MEKKIKPIKVKLVGKANCEFIVRNPKKIENWRAIYQNNQVFSSFIKVFIEEIK